MYRTLHIACSCKNKQKNSSLSYVDINGCSCKDIGQTRMVIFERCQEPWWPRIREQFVSLVYSTSKFFTEFIYIFHFNKFITNKPIWWSLENYQLLFCCLKKNLSYCLSRQSSSLKKSTKHIAYISPILSTVLTRWGLQMGSLHSRLPVQFLTCSESS